MENEKGEIVDLYVPWNLHPFSQSQYTLCPVSAWPHTISNPTSIPTERNGPNVIGDCEDLKKKIYSAA